MTAVQAELQKFKQELVEEGIEQGIEKGMSKSLLVFLAARGLPVREDVRARILSCTERARLERWLARAATAATADDVIAD